MKIDFNQLKDKIYYTTSLNNGTEITEEEILLQEYNKYIAPEQEKLKGHKKSSQLKQQKTVASFKTVTKGRESSTNVVKGSSHNLPVAGSAKQLLS